MLSGLGGTLVSVVAVVWRCALPEAERRQSCRLLSAVELADRVRWSTAGRSTAGVVPAAAATAAVNGNAPTGLQLGGRIAGGARGTAQQHLQQVQPRAPVAGNGTAAAPRTTANGAGASSDYDYGYWCGGKSSAGGSSSKYGELRLSISGPLTTTAHLPCALIAYCNVLARYYTTV
jgi:hypothetical protein